MADWVGEIRTIADATGSAAAQPQGGGGNKKQEAYLKSMAKNSGKSLSATLGIKFGAASILKQSQVFTGFIGSIFQLFGAMVDVILAPFLPVLIPGIRKLAETIPYIREYSQKIFDFLDRTVFEFLRNLIGGIPDGIKSKVVPILAAAIVGGFFLRITGLWGPFFKLVSWFMAKPIWAGLKLAMPRVLGFFGSILGRIPGVSALTKLVTAPFKNLGTRLGVYWIDFISGKWFKPYLKWIMNRTMSIIKPILAPIGRIASRILNGIWGKIGAKMIGGIVTGADGLIARALGAAVQSIDNIFKPVIGPAIKFFGSKGFLAKAAAKIVPRLGTMAKVVGSGAKAIPVLGAVAELGVGSYMAYQDYKKYGAKEAASRLALTAAMTGGALIDPTGLASAGASIGSNLLMDRAFRNNAVSEQWARKNQELVISVKGANNEIEYYEKKHWDSNNEIEVSEGFHTDRATMN